MTDIAKDLVVTTSIGVPLPPDYHAVSVALPTWNSVVGYEEGHEAVVASMKIGYPRFRFHNQVRVLMAVLQAQRFFELQEISAASDCEKVLDGMPNAAAVPSSAPFTIHRLCCR